MSDPTPTELRLVTAYQTEWRALVDLAVEARAGRHQLDIEGISTNAKKSPGAVAAKLNAIMAFLGEGMKPEEIVERGEKEILSAKQQKRAASTDGLVAMNFRVPPDLKGHVLESLDRIQTAMGYGTRENAWDWLCSVIETASDADIRHAVGEGKRT